MKNRLSRIYTKTGDQGTTGLGTGQRVAKDDLRVEAYGCIDELNSTIGLVIAHLGSDHDNLRLPLTKIQNLLFELGGELCIPGSVALTEEDTKQLESWIDRDNGQLPPLKEFILPGGSKAQCFCHLARTVARRAERRMVSLNDKEPINSHSLAYINRLSDLLFVWGRVLAKSKDGQEVLWQRRTQ